MESDQESTEGMDLGICSYESCRKGVKKSINGKVVEGVHTQGKCILRSLGAK